MGRLFLATCRFSNNRAGSLSGQTTDAMSSSASTTQGGQAPPRKRTKNWDDTEKEYLLDALRDNINVIEDKKTDAAINRKKATAWENVFRSFSTKYGETRTNKQLKEQWKSMKITAKKKFSHYQKERVKTGGGPPPKSPSALDNEIHQLIPAEFKQLNNPYDDDSQDGGPTPQADLPEVEPIIW